MKERIHKCSALRGTIDHLTITPTTLATWTCRGQTVTGLAFIEGDQLVLCRDTLR